MMGRQADGLQGIPGSSAGGVSERAKPSAAPRGTKGGWVRDGLR